ncbi:MAG: DUF4494 domain-containing protein [Tannerella sp.]|jgi:hypothetical protein|nr:DUF4494 domain-containing protein [Tannerella sp.]
MHNWFECKISYERVNEDGFQKKVAEPYLVDALSFTEAEARIIEEMRPYISSEFMVLDIKRARYYETFLNETGDKYYKVKVMLTLPDEKTGTEKRSSVQILAQATSVLDAIGVIDNGMKGTLVDYEIAAITETPLMNVFPYHPKT